MTAAVALGCYAAVLIYKAKNNPASLFVPRETGQLGTQAPDTTAAPVPATQDLTDVEPGVAVTPVPDDERDVRLRWSSEGYRFNDDIITVAFMGIDVLEEARPAGLSRRHHHTGHHRHRNRRCDAALGAPRHLYDGTAGGRDGTIVSYEMNRINASFAYGQGHQVQLP